MFDGNGVARDPKAGVALWQLAAEQGHAEALFNLGLAYWDGTGVAKDEREAARFWRQAVEQGSPEAMCMSKQSKCNVEWTVNGEKRPFFAMQERIENIGPFFFVGSLMMWDVGKN